MLIDFVQPQEAEGKRTENILSRHNTDQWVFLKPRCFKQQPDTDDTLFSR